MAGSDAADTAESSDSDPNSARVAGDGAIADSGSEGSGDRTLQKPTRIRTDFRETWIWADEALGYNSYSVDVVFCSEFMHKFLFIFPSTFLNEWPLFIRGAVFCLFHILSSSFTIQVLVFLKRKIYFVLI